MTTKKKSRFYTKAGNNLKNRNIRFKRFLGDSADTTYIRWLVIGMPVIDGVRKTGNGLEREICLSYW